MEIQTEPRAKQPLHIQAEYFLRQLIRQEEYMKGARLPNEVALAEQLNISRNTLRQAINKLVYEGLLVRKKKYGTTVAMQKVSGDARKWMSFSQEMKCLGMTVQNFELHVSKKSVPEDAATFFGVAPESRLVCLERLRGQPGQPFVYFISYFNPEIPITSDEDFTKPLYEQLEQNYGVRVKTSKEMISAMSADSVLAEKFEINEGDPILVRKRFVLDVNGMPVEYNVGYYRADCFTYSIEFVNE